MIRLLHQVSKHSLGRIAIGNDCPPVLSVHERVCQVIAADGKGLQLLDGILVVTRDVCYLDSKAFLFDDFNRWYIKTMSRDIRTVVLCVECQSSSNSCVL